MALDGDALSKKIFGWHAVGAMATGLPFIALEQQEADALANDIVEVSKHFDLSVDGKWFAVASLVATAGMIYGKRAMIVVALRKQQAAMRKSASAPATPMDIPPAPPQGGGYDFSGIPN